jgi:hypothetical protein
VKYGAFNLFFPVPFEAADEERLVADPLSVVRKYYPEAGVLGNAVQSRSLDPHRYSVTSEGGLVPGPIRTY